MFGKIHAEELLARSYREDIYPCLLERTQFRTEKKSVAIFYPRQKSTRIQWKTHRMYTIELNNFISKVASKLNIPSSPRNSDSELKSYVTDHVVASRLKENIDLPLDGSVTRALEEVDSEWQARGRV